MKKTPITIDPEIYNSALDQAQQTFGKRNFSGFVSFLIQSREDWKQFKEFNPAPEVPIKLFNEIMHTYKFLKYVQNNLELDLSRFTHIKYYKDCFKSVTGREIEYENIKGMLYKVNIKKESN